MTQALLFLLGIAAGSFLNVLSLRYQPDMKLFAADNLFGRSRCPYCKTTLRWYELIPLVSFFIQSGKCRHCHHNLTWQYPIVELLTGLVFVFAPGLWIPAILVLLLIALIDARLSLIPDGLNILLALCGAILIAIQNLGSLNVWLNHLLGAVLGAASIGIIIAVTRGRGMGIGDWKMSAALGFLFGWPKILLILGAAFAIGGVWAGIILILQGKSFKDAIPFGPFLSIAAILAVFFGDAIIKWYGG